MSKATDCNAEVTLSPSASRMDTKVGTRRLSKDSEQRGEVEAMTLKMSSVSGMRTWSEKSYWKILETVANYLIKAISLKARLYSSHMKLFEIFLQSLRPCRL